MRFLVFLSLLLVNVFGKPEDYMTVLNSGNNIDKFSFCRTLGDPTTSGAVMFWSIQESKLVSTINAQTNGWIAFGPTRATSSNFMKSADIVFGYVNNGQSNVSDMWISDTLSQQPCSGGFGVCPDTSKSGNNNVNGSISSIDGIRSMHFERPLAAVDAIVDLPIQNGTHYYLWALRNDDLFIQHDQRGIESFDLFAAPCPNPCNNGQCRKGCCFCNDGWAGIDCSIQIEIPNNNQSSSLSPNIIASEFQFNSDLDDNLKIYWNVNETAGTIEIGLLCKCTGWIGFGLSNNKEMIDSDVTIGGYDNSGPFAVDYYITDYSACINKKGVCPDTIYGGSNDVLEFNGQEIDGMTHLKFLRKFQTNDTKNDLQFGKGTRTVIFAYSNSNDNPSIKHDAKGIASIDFFSGTATVDDSTKRKTIAHALLMFFGWSVFVPIGSALARFGKRHAWWFNVHRIIQSVAMGLVLSGFVISVDFSTTHFDTLHKIFGLVIVLLGLAQPILGTVADRWYHPERTKTPHFPDKTHWVIGWTSFTAALINIAIGLKVYHGFYGGGQGLFIASIVFGSVLLVTFFVYSLIRLRR